jgi:CubicO group peptidase (beta-lactamase class C family)
MMDGFPPHDAALVTLANWRLAPFNQWAFHHVREIVPTADIPNDPVGTRDLPEQPLDPDEFRITTPENRNLSLDAFLQETSTDGIVAIHRGQIVLERYARGMNAETPHILMSVSKSMLGLLAGALADKGILDIARPATDFVPELAATAYDGVTVRQLLDMRAGIAFDEDYLATSGPIISYRKATNWNPLVPGDTPVDLRSFFRELIGPDGPHGGRFHYISPNTDLLGWVIERAANRRYADLMCELIWRPMGAYRSAYITVDRLGAPRSSGGMCATTRDLALVGLLIAEGGARNGRQIVPQAWVEDIVYNGDEEAWKQGPFVDYFQGAAMHYRSNWYVKRGRAPLVIASGIHGQCLFVDIEHQLVVAKLASHPSPLNADQLALSMAAMAALREVVSP